MTLDVYRGIGSNIKKIVTETQGREIVSYFS